jgi:hypothetical protein
MHKFLVKKACLTCHLRSVCDKNGVKTGKRDKNWTKTTFLQIQYIRLRTTFFLAFWIPVGFTWGYTCYVQNSVCQGHLDFTRLAGPLQLIAKLLYTNMFILSFWKL